MTTSTLDRKTETDAMSWMLLQAFMGRAVSVTHDGRSVMFEFGAEIDAEQFTKFMIGARRQMKTPENNNAGPRRRSPGLTE